MPRYKVKEIYKTTVWTTVEADNREEAVSKIEEAEGDTDWDTLVEIKEKQ